MGYPSPMEDPRKDRTSAVPLLVAGVIFVAVVAIWFPYMQKGAFQDEVTQPGVNTTPEEPNVPGETDSKDQLDPADERGPNTTPASSDDES